MPIEIQSDSRAELVELIKKSLYVDDLLTGTDNVQEGFELYKDSKELMAKGAFNLCKWHSNFSELLQLINNKEESIAQTKTEKANGVVEEEALVKTLGVCWNTAHR